MNTENTSMGMAQGAEVVRGGGSTNSIGFSTHYDVECFDKDGNLKWEEHFDNLVVNTGLDDNLDKFFKGSGYTAAHFVGLTDGTPTPAAADTMLTHAGWAEVVPYSDATRPALTANLGTVASQSVDNSASKAVFNINATETVGGAFVAGSATKSETASILYGVGAFASDKAVTSGDTLNVTITLTAAAV